MSDVFTSEAEFVFDLRRKVRPGAVGIFLGGTRRPAAKRKNRPALRVPRRHSRAQERCFRARHPSPPTENAAGSGARCLAEPDREGRRVRPHEGLARARRDLPLSPGRTAPGVRARGVRRQDPSARLAAAKARAVVHTYRLRRNFVSSLRPGLSGRDVPRGTAGGRSDDASGDFRYRGR